VYVCWLFVCDKRDYGTDIAIVIMIVIYVLGSMLEGGVGIRSYGSVDAQHPDEFFDAQETLSSSTNKNSLTSGSGRYMSAADSLASGSDKYTSAAGSLASGSGKYQSATGSLVSGTGKYRSAASSLTSGSGRYLSAAESLASDSGRYLSAAGSLTSGSGAYLSAAESLYSESDQDLAGQPVPRYFEDVTFDTGTRYPTLASYSVGHLTTAFYNSSFRKQRNSSEKP
jgi:uncharacterized phage infection (PIP) family protein YhgE